MKEAFSDGQAFSCNVSRIAIAKQNVLRHALIPRHPGVDKSAAERTAMLEDNNPEVDIRVFSNAVNKSYTPDFLAAAIMNSDGFYLLGFSARQAIIAAYSISNEQTIAAVPFDMGRELVNFRPGKIHVKKSPRRRFEASSLTAS